MDTRSAPLMGISAVACGRYCASRRNVPASADVVMTISAGPMPSSHKLVCSPCMRTGLQRDNPDEVTANWRAVCGRTARTVRRAGTASAVLDPYHAAGTEIGKRPKLASLRQRTLLYPISAPATWRHQRGPPLQLQLQHPRQLQLSLRGAKSNGNRRCAEPIPL